MSTEIQAALSRAADETVAVAFDRIYRTSAADLWAAVTDPERLARWYAPVEGELRVGGTFVQKFDDMDAPVCTIVACEPASSFAFIWPVGGVDTLVTVTVTAAGDDARLTLVHERLTALAAAGYGAGWETYLDPFLTAHLAGHEASDWMEIWQERHAAYGAALRERGWLVE